MTVETGKRTWGVVASHGAAAWSVVFGLVHVYWLAGGGVGLPPGTSLASNLPLLIIDVVAIPLCALAALVALAPIRPWGSRVPRWLLHAAVWGVAALLVVHALPSVVDWLLLASGRLAVADLDPMARFVTLLYEPVFLTGGLLFGLTGLGCVRGR
ncbi:DUF3995 domain-containing protein [Saccharopolyspora sp. NFXS83]|uniref:DUF3995 domain-containing protein n=1 Tax=Saccharopolyspora sp. NFXS83 TaxID=2993560 RepID=UPI00224A90C4|nr:DUF3995 domain-containing protein [Saccharopolyspora sp. NFXS83]MCX2729091.1 DUF3995 domain-containing protein [Saccharopolyspora sp. NFXS83]